MEKSEKTDDFNVSSLFDEGLEIYDKINESEEPTSSNITQSQVKKAIELFEETTKIVSLVGMFSTNETIEEVATSDVKFFLLPAMLGTLTLKLTANTSTRLEILKAAEIYFLDFLKRCKDYGIINHDIPDTQNTTLESKNQSVGNIAVLVETRNRKIQRFKDKKALEAQLSELKTQMDNMSFDDDIKRGFFLTLIKSLANASLEDLESIETEKPLLDHMEKLRKEGKTFPGDEERARVPSKPLKPIIITKDEIQKKIYGAGYPSLPTMTVQEFYDKRARDGDFPAADAPKAPVLPAWVVEEAAAHKASDEEAAEERRVEDDDPELLDRKRAMDDFKDTHRRGYGNRMNRS